MKMKQFAALAAAAAVVLTAAVVSTGDVPCWSTSVNTRTDTQEVADFLRPYLALR